MKEKEVSKDISSSQKKATKRKNEIGLYHRLYVSVSMDGKNIYVIRLVAEERKDCIKVKPKTVKLYDVFIEKNTTGTAHSVSSNIPNRVLNPGSTITIRDMLRNVKDYGQNPYINKDGSGNFSPIFFFWNK